MDDLTALRLYNDMKEFYSPNELPDWYHEPRRFAYYVKMYSSYKSKKKANLDPNVDPNLTIKINPNRNS